ncbi:skin secretory protein xP2-like [Bacillus rossius redtenbacheri]|uniref:skin secretory protein xP2-like n=1 Tax=Bacillus rossius redtenbacheri TaxID=93214 RepID=UPI002FDC7C0F
MLRTVLLLVAVAQAALGGSQFAVRLPFLNPAGVTYVNGPAPAGLAAGPAYGYAATGPALGYAATAPALGYAATAPALGYAATGPALGYAAHAPALGYAAVPTVHHVPGVADVPVTRVEATPGVVQKLVDVHKPAVQTRRFEVRRPAIQKQFYDVEERVVVRPAGSALLELEEPLSKTQRGPAVVSPAVAPAPLAYAAPGGYLAAAPGGYLAAAHGGYLAAAPSPAPVFVSTTPAPAFDYPSPTPAPSGPPAFDDQGSDDTVVIDSEFAARSRAQSENQAQAQAQAQEQAQAQVQARYQAQAQAQAQEQAQAQVQARFQAQAQAQAQEQAQAQARFQAQAEADAQARYQSTPAPSAAPAPRLLPSPTPALQLRSGAAAYEGLIPAARASGDVVPSLRDHLPHEVSQANQQRLIQLLTARDGIAEVGFGRSGPAGAPVGDAGLTRARVLSATPAPLGAAPAGERVQTRRVVVSRPIETVQEFDVVEPVTKLERVAVQHPTLFKTLRHEVARVPASYPVLGKAFAPAFAPAVGYYH